MQIFIHNDPLDKYYNMMKGQFLNFIPKGPNSVLDIGCGSGRLGESLRKEGKASNIIGVEIFRPAAQYAEKTYDHVYVGNIESMELDFYEQFDFIVCGDIIEHLVDPWRFLGRINHWLKKDGIVLCTLPNIRFWLILYEIIFLGVWRYRDDGILDKTHLRFFTNKTAKEIFNDNNFDIIHTEIIIDGWKKKTMNIVTGKMFKEFLGKQILYVFKKKGECL
jgi:2-polyprenyl-3-methyl-5-hydroxy-6-metoxy-1,4-benzoquinol methylase